MINRNRAIIKLHYRCNNQCKFCHCHQYKNRQNKIEDIFDKIDQARYLGIDQIILSGGEPTIYPELGKIMQYLRHKSIASGFITNARMFSYAGFLKMIRNAGSNYFYVSLHSHSSEIHDYLTSTKGAFEQTLAGIQNIVRYIEKPEIILNCVITSQNVDYLKNFPEFSAKNRIDTIKFSYPELKGLMKSHHGEIDAGLKHAGEKVNEAMAAAQKIGVSCCYDGLPYCLIDPSYRFKFDNLESNRIYYMSEVFENGFHRTDESERGKNGICSGCSYTEVCEGPYAGSDTADLKPIVEPVPNYFVFREIAEIRGAGKNCLLESVSSFPSYFKQIVMQGSNSYHLFEAESSFFKPRNFLSAIHKGHLYLMNGANTFDSSGVSGDSGFECMVKMERLAGCKNCDKACPGIYSAGTETVFDLDDIPKNLTNIRGDVLDVGFGDMVFEDLFFQVLKGKIRYTGIEPDKQKFDRAVLKYPEAFLINRTIERFKPGNVKFDYILLLGSFNHIKDLDRGLRVMQRVLKPHGKLIVIENDIFGIAGSGFQNAWRMDGRMYQHYRNSDMEDAEIILEKAGFISCFKSDGKEKRNNFWLIEAEKNARVPFS